MIPGGTHSKIMRLNKRSSLCIQISGIVLQNYYAGDPHMGETFHQHSKEANSDFNS